MTNEFDDAVAVTLGINQKPEAPIMSADEAVASVINGDRSESARVGFSAAIDTDPDYYAEARRVARRVGVPVETVINLPKETKRLEATGAIDFNALAKTAPVTASLLSDIERAKVAHDNLPSMVAIERSFMGGIAEPVQRGLAQGRRAMTLLFDQMGIFRGLERRRATAAAAHGIDYNPSTELAALLSQQQREAERYPVPDDIARGMQDISNAQNLGDALAAIRTNPRAVLETTLQSLGASAPALVGAASGSVFGPGGTAAGAGLGSFAVEYGNTLQDVMAEKGVNGTDPMSIHAALNNPELMASAREKALKRGMPVAIFDALTAGLAGKLLAGAKPTVGSVGARAAGELGLQAGGGAAGEAGAQLASGEYKPGDILMEAFAEMPSAIIEVPGNYRHAMESAQRAQKDAEFIGSLNTLARDDKLAARDPETFERFVEQAAENGPVTHVFIGANELMQSGIADEIAAISPSVADQLQESLQTGGQIAIPVAEYMARIAPTEYAQGLLDHLKTEPEGFSRTEANAFMQSGAEELRSETERVLAGSQAEQAFSESAAAVHNEIKDKLDATGRFSPKNNAAYASLHSSFFATQAQRHGVTPEEMYRRYEPTIQAEGGSGYEQPAWHGTPYHGIEETGFKLNRIGSGEGAQVYGHGIYFASQKDVAESYRSDLASTITVDGKPLLANNRRVGTTGDQDADDLLVSHKGDADAAIADARDGFPDAAEKLESLRGKVEVKNEGQLYSVEIPEDEDLLDWDKPLSEQPQKVRNALERHRAEFEMERGTPTSKHPDLKTYGSTIYGHIEKMLGSPQAASEYLLKLGIPGLRYLDGNSRTAGEGSHNYVIWDEDLLTPEKAQIQAYYQQGWLDGQPYNPPAEALTTQQEQLIVDTFNENAGGEKAANSQDVQESKNIYAKSKAFQALAQSEGWHIVPGAEGDKYFLLGNAPFRGTWGNAITIPVRVSDHSNVNRGHHSKESAINLAPDDGYAFDTFESALWKLRNAGENEDFELTFGGEEATYFQRSQETKAAYEARIDELFNGAKAKPEGVKVLDRSDMLDMLGLGDKPLKLAEGKVIAGQSNHPKITAEVWKKIPEWVENPAMVFDSDTVAGRLVFIAPEKVRGNDVRIVIEPKQNSLEAHVLVNAYDTGTGTTPYSRWARDRLLRYADIKNASRIDERFGLQLPDILRNPAFMPDAQIHGMGRGNKKALRRTKILTENNLVGYRKSHDSLSQGGQEARGAFNPDTLTITLLKKADLSTFLHETGHFFLEVTADMASREDAPEGVRQDMNTLLNWFGVGSLAEWNGMDIEARRAHHEKFARGFEAYLYEGNPPSVEMQGVFQRFRQWLIRVYKDLRNLNVELTDEVRGVFDRMLATDEEIALAERARNMMPLFETAEQGGMTAEEFAAYQASSVDGTGQAIEELQARRLRDMKWLRNAHGRELKRLQKEVAGLRAEMRESVAEEVAAMPIYRAMRWLKTGEIEIETSGERDVLGRFLPSKSRQDKHILKTEKGHKLLIAALREMYPPGALVPVDIEPLIKNQMAGHEGLSPDLIADMFGFSSGDELVRTLLETPPAEKAIEDMTDERMLERYGDLVTEKGIKEAADRAIHNETHARLVTTEANALARMTGGKKILDAAAKTYVAAVVARSKVRDLLPGKYTRAEAKAAKAAEKAFKAGDIATAATEKRNQVINQRAAREALAAQDEVRKIEARFKTIAAANQKRGGNDRNIDLVNAAQAILAEYGVGVRGKNPRQYMDAVKSYDPELFAALEPLLRDAEQNARPIADLTVGELRALRDDINSLWHMARRERMVEIDGKMIDRQEVVQQLADRLEELGVPKEVPGEKKAVTEREKMARYLMGARAGLRRVESWADRMDGGNITGPFRRFVFQPISEAADRYRADSAAYLKRYRDLLNAISPSLKPGRIEAKEIGYTFGFSKGDAGKAELLHAILHTGNESNKRKLLLGRGWATKTADGGIDTSLWDTFINRMIAEGKLTKADFDFAQGVWDLLEETKPLAQKTHREVFGRYFDEITANEFTTPFGTYRGGYVPAIYDTFEVQDATVNAEIDAVNKSNTAMFPATNRGFTRGRVEYNKPLALDLRLLPQHLDKVLLFSHLETPVRDVMRTLRDRGFSGKLSRYDPVAYTDLLLPWLNRAAKQTVETPTTGWGGKLADRFFRAARSRAGMSAMFANMTNALQQITGLSITALKVKPSYLKAATWRYLRAPSEVAEQAAQLSTFMANRQSNEVQQMRSDIEALLINPNAYEQAKDWTAKHAYFLQSAFQNVVDNITWAAAFDQATAEGHSQDEAVRAANAAVRETQGSLQPEDISRFESGSALSRVFTQFQSYFNMQANVMGTEFAKVAQGMGLRKGAGRLFYVFLFGFLVPAWFSEAIVLGMRGGPDDDEDDGYLDEFLEFFFGAPARNAAAMAPGVGQAGMLIYNSFNRKPYDDRMSTAPAVSMIESAASAPHSVYNAIAEDGSAKRAIRDTLTMISIVTGMPVTVLGKPLGYAADVAQGKVEPTGPIDAARGVVSGVAGPESKR